MDNPATEPASTSLDTNDAAAIFANMLDDNGDLRKDDPNEPEPVAAEPEKPEGEPPDTAEAEPQDDPLVTIKVDGKDIEVPLSELKNGYQRQADYTRKTMEVAEQRKAAESEVARARQEREQYAHGLQQTSALLQAQLQEQSKIDWQGLINSDPVEYLKQMHLAQTRQAQLQQTVQEQQRVQALQKAEAEHARSLTLQRQQEELLAKLPDWKDEGKAKAEKAAIRDLIKSYGYTDDDVDGIVDHRAILMARDALQARQWREKALAASKKVERLPGKVERPGSNETASVDKRGAAFQRLQKTGRVEDAASLMAAFV